MYEIGEESYGKSPQVAIYDLMKAVPLDIQNNTIFPSVFDNITKVLFRTNIPPQFRAHDLAVTRFTRYQFYLTVNRLR